MSAHFVRFTVKVLPARQKRGADQKGRDLPEQSLAIGVKGADTFDALRQKISRERVGVEVEKIFKGPDPYTGLKLINDLKLYQSVFADPASTDSPDAGQAQTAYDALSHILEHRAGLCLALRPKESQD